MYTLRLRFAYFDDCSSYDLLVCLFISIRYGGGESATHSPISQPVVVNPKMEVRYEIKAEKCIS